MRLISLVLFLAGLAIGVAYPWYATHHGGHDLGTWPVRDASGAFRPVVVPLAATDAPVSAVLDVTAVHSPAPVAGQTVLTITAAVAGKTVLAQTLDLATATARSDTPQTQQTIFRLDAGSIATVADGDYTFTVGPGDAEDVAITSVDLLLSGGAGVFDERAQPVGLSLAAIGFILLVLSFRRGGTPGAGNPNSQPPPPRWGRGAAS